jgi:thioredoxin reductase (NADPH)
LSTAYDLIVVGEGIAGLTCAAHAASLGLRTATTEGNLFGGLVINVADLEGFDGGGSGVDLASSLMEANATAGIENLGAAVVSIEPAGNTIKVVTEGDTYSARAVVIASGARLNKLGVPGEEQFDHRGVSQCADCDGPMFQGEHVVVVGGGDAAFQEAAALSKYVDKVTILMRGGSPRAHAALVNRVNSLGNVTVRGQTSVTAILGAEMVNAIMTRSGAAEPTRMDCAGVFVFVGLTPNSEMAPSAAKRDAKGAIETDEKYRTAVNNVYAVGAVRAGYSGKLNDAIKEAKAAASDVAQRLGN